MATVIENAMCIHWILETKFVIKMQCRCRTQYGKDPPSDNAIRHWLQQFQDKGSDLHRKGEGKPSILQEAVNQIEKCFLESQRNQLESFFAVRYTTNDSLEGCSLLPLLP
jgi:hypothetical protein